MWIIRNRKIFYWLSGVLAVASVASFLLLPLNYSVEFTGGTVLEVTYEGDAPSQEDLRMAVAAAGAEDASVRPSGSGLSVKSSPLATSTREAVIEALSIDGRYKPSVASESTLGPSLGKELASRMALAFVVISLAILLFVAYAFRGVSTPVSSWAYGLTTVVTLAHDVLITAGAFVVANRFLDAPMDALFVTALLVMLGYSVNDTIVVFDRVRERLGGLSDRERAEGFERIVGESLRATIRRSISTSATVALSLVVLAIFGATVTRAFATALAIGVVAGTYSSIFLAAPILVSWKLRQDRRARIKN
ncbi:MAG TPA: protein translocase subunit SecF [Candidatus Paceibacterota bacterium]